MPATDSRSTLLKAYRDACYDVQVDADVVVMRVDHALPATLEAYFAARSINAAAFISAANPLSRPLPAAANAARHAALLRALRELGVPWLPGIGRDPGGAWPAEESALALGVGRIHALRLAGQFEQNAYIEAVPGAPARLVMTAHWRTHRDRRA